MGWLAAYIAVGAVVVALGRAGVSGGWSVVLIAAVAVAVAWAYVAHMNRGPEPAPVPVGPPPVRQPPQRGDLCRSCGGVLVQVPTPYSSVMLRCDHWGGPGEPGCQQWHPVRPLIPVPEPGPPEVTVEWWHVVWWRGRAYAGHGWQWVVRMARSAWRR